MGASCSCNNQNLETINELDENTMNTKIEAYQNIEGIQSYVNCNSSLESSSNQIPSKFIIVYPGNEHDFDTLQLQLQKLNKNGQFVIKECYQKDRFEDSNSESDQKCSLSLSSSSNQAI